MGIAVGKSVRAGVRVRRMKRQLVSTRCICKDASKLT